MSKLLEWHTCPHCKKEKYCPPDSMRDHVEDCSQRPTKRLDCPQCGAGLMPVHGGAICSSPSCDYQLHMLPGGKS